MFSVFFTAILYLNMTYHTTHLITPHYDQVACIAKVVVLSECMSVLGMHIACPNAGEIIQGFAVAFRKGLNYQVRYVTLCSAMLC
jgi:pyruvate/2-oxoglutarate dehydrogenase complex dihydrolipoamide dehydrogenase (E3) component